MIDRFLIGDMQADVIAICKRRYKKGPFDFSKRWKEEYEKVWSLGYRGVNLWLEENDSPSLIKCQECGKDQIYIACPDYCVKCHEKKERNGVPINGNHLK